MPPHEHVFLARQDLSAQQVEDLTKQYTDVISGLGGKVTKNEYWGLKSLSYRINKNRKAHMTLLNVDAPAAAVTEIERQERLSEDVLRYLTVRLFPFYIVHQTVTVVAGHHLAKLGLPVAIEAGTLIAVTFAGCFLAYEAARRLGWAGLLLGVKPERRSPLLPARQPA